MRSRRRLVTTRTASVAVLGAVLAVAPAVGPAGAATSPVTFRVQTSPDPGTTYSSFDAVAMASGGAWAVGSYRDSSGIDHTLVARHTSSGWAQVPSPNRWGGLLTAVAATSSSNAWAVGSHNAVAGVLILRWNGTVWAIQSAPYSGDRNLPGLTGLSGVAALSASAAWAVGGWAYDNCSGFGCGAYALIEHWNGTSWVKQCCAGSLTGTVPGSWLYAVAAADSDHVWAVGRRWNDAGTIPHVSVLQWSGTRWASPATPDPNRGDLLGVAALSATDVWAVGSYVDANKLVRTLVLHYNGTAWSKVASPNVGAGNNVLTAVHAASAGDIWAAGHVGSKPLVEHYDGSGWTVQTLPDVGNGALLGVAGSAANGYAVGDVTSGGDTHTLVLHGS